MPQFALYRNRDPATRARYPFLLDVQSDLLEPLSTRVVVPLSPLSGTRGIVMEQLTPVLTIDGKQYLMLTPQLAGVTSRVLGQAVAQLTSERGRIIAALDLLITGI